MAVGIVIVSHSARLAAGVVELAGQMVQGAVSLAAAGGIADDTPGTSVERIMEALQAVDGPDGSLVLLDLGSAILSTEMALDMLTGVLQGPVELSFAPLVEGAVVAALEAAQGHPLAAVRQAAQKAANVDQLRLLKPLDNSDEEGATTSPSPLPAAMQAAPTLEQQFTLRNAAGLHARPAALLVQTVGRFQAQVSVQARNRQADARSIMEVLSLGARQGDPITVHATGDDAQEVLAELNKLIAADFYETSEASLETENPTASTASVAQLPPVPAQSAHGPWHGIPIARGLAVAPALLYTAAVVALDAVPQRTVAEADITREQEMLRQALEAAAQDVVTQARQLRGQANVSEAAIFEAQALMLRDPTLFATAQRLIKEQHSDAASAIARAGEQLASTLARLDQQLIAARAVDIRDALSRVLEKLGYQAASRPDLSALPQPVVLLAHDLTPSDVASLRPATIAGICTVQGGPTDHSAILARALGIPAMTGLPEQVLQTVHAGDELALDAEQGLLYHLPPADIRAQFMHRLREQQQKRDIAEVYAPLLFHDHHIALLANVANETEAEAARRSGAEGIGLLRTELLFAAEQTWPNEDAQRRRYAQVFRAFYGGGQTRTAPLVVRTLDVGADKPLPALQKLLQPWQEANPALGLRGIRLHLAHPEFFTQQLRALLLAAGDTGAQLHIMFPMIATVDELRSARAIFDRVYREVREQQQTIPAHVPLGIMVEVPSAALMATELAALADFFSIGANDLLQYTLAADRTSSAVAHLSNPLQPAFLRLIRSIAEAGRRAGKPVAVCGEIAGDPRLAPLLVGLGVAELSMAPAVLPQVRAALSHGLTRDLATLAESLCRLQTSEEVEQAYSDFLRES